MRRSGTRQLGDRGIGHYRLGDFRFPDEEHEKPFRVYSNYLADLAGVIGGRYGIAATLVEGVQVGMRSHRTLRRVQKRRHGSAAADEIERSLCRAWANARSLERNVEDEFIEEANTWMPGQAYFAVHHAMHAVLVAAAGRSPNDQRKVLNEISREAVHGRLIFPWSAACEGCPELGSERYIGVSAAPGFSPLSAPDPASAEARIALLLKTTRRKELERRYADERGRKPRPGRSRRNDSSQQKESMAANLQPTTLFDFFRLRKKVHYGDPDAFVLGAAGSRDARQLAESLMIVTDATVAVLECLVATYRGRSLVARSAIKYADRISASAGSVVGRRSQAWGDIVPAKIDS